MLPHVWLQQVHGSCNLQTSEGIAGQASGNQTIVETVVANDPVESKQGPEQAPVVEETQSSERSQKLFALAHNDQSGAIYKKEMDGLANFLGQSARLLLPSQRRQKAK